MVVIRIVAGVEGLQYLGNLGIRAQVGIACLCHQGRLSLSLPSYLPHSHALFTTIALRISSVTLESSPDVGTTLTSFRSLTIQSGSAARTCSAV